MLTSCHLHEKSREVCINARSPPASLAVIGQVTKHTTVKWPIVSLQEESDTCPDLLSLQKRRISGASAIQECAHTKCECERKA